MKIKIALIPTYEPEENFIDLVKELSKTDFKIVVVDDGSGKEYKHIFDRVAQYTKVLSYKENKGKGHALKTGLKYIDENYKSYIVVTMDCDGQHTVKDANRLALECENKDNILFLGKRIRSNKTPIRSKIGNAITRFVYKSTTGLDVYDTQTGLRAFSNKLMDLMLDIDGDRYEYEMNVLLKCAKEKIKIKEIEIDTIYIDNNSNSHFNPLKDSIIIYKEFIKFSLSSLIGFVTDYLLYTIIYLFSNKLVLSNVLARIISSLTNYSINRKIVFKDKKKVSVTIIKYFILSVCILLVNTLILSLLVNVFNINAILAKVIVELLLFIFSYKVQRLIIFRK